MRRRTPHAVTLIVIAALILALLCVPTAGAASTGGLQYDTPAPAQPVAGGVDPNQPLPAPAVPLLPATPEDPLPGQVAQVRPDGLAAAPAGAPVAVQAIIDAGNRIAKARYVWGGGHTRWEDNGYDCSGSVSYALHGAGLLESSMPSGGFMRWGDAGPGQWVTIYANRGHMYMVVAGLRFDTSGQRKAGTRWQAAPRPTKGFRVLHPAGL